MNVIIVGIIKEFKRYLKLKSNLAERSIKNYTQYISVLFHRGNLFKIDAPWIEDKILLSNLSSNTKRAYIIALRHFFTWLQWEQVKDDNPAKYIKIPARKCGRPKDLMPEIVIRIFRGLQDNRERVVIGMLYYCGLRAEELQDLKLSDVNLDKHYVWVRDGKGGKERFIPYAIDNAFTDLIIRYIREYNITDWFITTRNHDRIAYMTLREIIDNIGKRINYHFTAHQLRHSIATYLYNGDMDLLALKEFLGHSDVKTTQQYVRVYVTTIQRKYNKVKIVKGFT